MESRKMIWAGMIVGSGLGGFLPTIVGIDAMSMTAVFTTAIGGILGIWGAYIITH